MPVRSPTLWRSAPWLAIVLAAKLVVTPTYGLGLMIAPLTLVGSWVALRRDGARSLTVRVGAATNLVFLVLALAILTVAWGWAWAITISWGVLLAVVGGLSLLTRSRRPDSGGRTPGKRNRLRKESAASQP